MAHQIGLELCKKILKDEYEYVLSTHIDKCHIHNHIIFNNVNMATGKCYQSNKKNYHQIRYQSDKLCKENNLSVIDEFYENYKKSTKQMVSHGMKMNRQSVALLGKANFNLTLIV
ncbi:relaxase/mobilization nuclease domain-containing protein [Treponema pectinovorum]